MPDLLRRQKDLRCGKKNIDKTTKNAGETYKDVNIQ